MIVTTRLPALDHGVLTQPLTFVVCDACGVWDRDANVHAPRCPIGRALAAEHAARLAAEAREKAAERERRAAARSAGRPTWGRPPAVTTSPSVVK